MKATIRIGGMHCAACVSRIERKISALDGVESVTVNLVAENATVVFDPKRVTMDQVGQVVAKTGYDFLGPAAEPVSPATASSALPGLRNRFLVGILGGSAAMALMHYHPMLPLPLPILSLLITAPLLSYAAFPIFRAAFFSLRSGALTMDVMYALGIGVSFASSLFATLGILLSSAFLFYDTALMLAGFLMLGRYLETRARQGTSDAIHKLVRLRPQTAILIEDGQEREVSVDLLLPGALLRVKPGQQIPVDAQIEDGGSYVDESMMTGEPLPVWKIAGSSVLGGTMNKSNTLKIRATKTGSEMLLSKIIAMVAQAQSSKPPLAQLADRVVVYFIPVILGLAIAAAIFWFTIGNQSLVFALQTFISIIVIACPCALGLATPTAVVVGIGRGADFGILIRNGVALERAPKIGVFVFDKTGTLTQGQPEVTDIAGFGLEPSQALAYAASLEHHSVHPLAEAIVRKARESRLKFPDALEVVLVEGQGISGRVGEHKILLGSPDWFTRSKIALAKEVNEQIEEFKNRNKIMAVLSVDNSAFGVFGLEDSLRPGAKNAIASLHSMGLRLVMASGDHARNAQSVADRLGISDVRSDLLPQSKSDLIREFQGQGQTVAFAGDGVNDAPALAQADLGLAMGGGTDVAIEAGDIVLVKSDLLGATAALQLGKKVMRRIRQNLFWAFAYNIALLPLAAGVLYPLTGLNFRPEYGALAMALSSVTVVSLSLLLKMYTPPALRLRQMDAAGAEISGIPGS